jgi:hypothetical protein
MLAEMAIATLTNVSSADIAHRITTNAGELVAAASLDEGDIAARTGSLHSFRHSTFDGRTECSKLGFEADVYVVPFLRARKTGSAGTERVETYEFKPTAFTPGAQKGESDLV